MDFTPLAPVYNVETLFQEGSAQDPILGPVIRVLLGTNLIDAKDVAKQLKTDARKLSNAVELLTGQTLHQFILDWRFMQSQQLLHDTDLSYSEVVTRCGYANENVFIEQYKKRLHTTPHTFRTGYRIRNSNYTINRPGNRTRLNGENRDAKNKVFSKK